ncbi:hypothetical protein VRK_18330 [Vibrio sp. MEBiC08052]|nr:hypothetical protein VRK_18330 [Vibrio sp. MEBiC08052]
MYFTQNQSIALDELNRMMIGSYQYFIKMKTIDILICEMFFL